MKPTQLLALVLATSTALFPATALTISGVYYDPVQAGSDRNIHYPQDNKLLRQTPKLEIN